MRNVFSPVPLIADAREQLTIKNTKSLCVPASFRPVPFDLFPLRKNRQGTTGMGALHTHTVDLFPWAHGTSGNNWEVEVDQRKPSSRFCCGKTATAAKDSEEYLK